MDKVLHGEFAVFDFHREVALSFEGDYE